MNREEAIRHAGSDDAGVAALRVRRSCLFVPAPNAGMAASAAASDADLVFFDLEDGCPPIEKVASRRLIVEALRTLEFGAKTRAVRVNDVTTPWCYGDLVEVISEASDSIDCVVLPKVQDASHVHFVDHLLTQIEDDIGIKQRIGLELQIETASGAVNLGEISRASRRTEALVLGTHDYDINLGNAEFATDMPDPIRADDRWLWVMSEIANHALATGVQAIDGVHALDDREASYRESCRRSRHLGFDGKWCVNADQIPWANAEFTPSQAAYLYAERVLDAYGRTRGEDPSTVTFEGKLIDETTRRTAERVAARGRAAGLRCSS